MGARKYKQIEVGDTFGDWTVLRDAERYRGEATFLCRCRCKRECVVRSTSLTSGVSLMCRHCQTQQPRMRLV